MFYSCRFTDPTRPFGTLNHSKIARLLHLVAWNSLVDYRLLNNPGDDKFHWAPSSQSSTLVTAICMFVSLSQQSVHLTSVCTCTVFVRSAVLDMYKDLTLHEYSNRVFKLRVIKGNMYVNFCFLKALLVGCQLNLYRKYAAWWLLFYRLLSWILFISFSYIFISVYMRKSTNIPRLESFSIE